jgi:transposase
MSYPWTAEESLRRRREQAVKDVLERGMSPLAAATTRDVLTADVKRWAAQAENDAAAGPEA